MNDISRHSFRSTLFGVSDFSPKAGRVRAGPDHPTDPLEPSNLKSGLFATPAIVIRKLIPALMLIFLIPLFTVGGATAAETGTLQGIIMDADGRPLPGALVTLEGRNLQGIRKAVTTENGEFRILSLPPGLYTISSEMDGFQTAHQTDIRVVVGTNIRLEMEMLPIRVETEITVKAKAPLIDVTSTEIGQDISADEFQKLPNRRMYQDLFNYIPGVRSRVDTQWGGSGAGNPDVRGEGRMGNNFLIDGISARNPVWNGYGHNINFDAIEEIQILTDGFSAEYGRATGLIANVITKSGGNQLEGTLLVDYLTTDDGGERSYNKAGDAAGQLNQDFLIPMASVGGPIVQDKLWYFALVEYMDQTWSDSSQMANRGFEYDRTDSIWWPFLKATWSISANHSINASWTGQRWVQENTDDFYADPESQRQVRWDMDHLVATYRGILSPNAFLEVKLGHTDNLLQYLPYRSTEDPSYRDRATGERWGGAISSLDESSQRNLKIHYTHYVDDTMGNHTFKGGVEYLEADHLEASLLPGGGYSYVYNNGVPETMTIFAQVPGVSNDSAGYAAFIQDTWNLSDRLTLNLGYRLETMTMDNNKGIQYLDFTIHAPRLGAAWDITGDSRNVVKAFCGRFHDFTSLIVGGWINSSSTVLFDEYGWVPGEGNWTDDYGNTFNGGWEWRYTQGGEEGEPFLPLENVDPNLKTHHLDQLVLGYERKLTETQVLGLRYIHGRTRDLIEDIQNDEGEFLLINLESKRRDYDGVELTYHKAMSSNFMLFGSYTWSQTRGTSPGQYEAGEVWYGSDTVSVYGDSPPGEQPGSDWYGLGSVDDEQGWYGYLPDDIRHHVKLTGLYRAPWAIDVGLAFEYGSGRPYSRKSWHYIYQDYFIFPEGRGTYRLPDIYWLDLRLEKTLPLGERFALGIFANILNLLDSDEVIQVWEGDDPEAGEDNPFSRPRYRQSPRSFRLGLRFTF